MEKIKNILNNIFGIDYDSRVVTQNAMISGVCKVLSLVVSYIYVPIMLKYLGVEKYGLWVTILNILTWVSYCDIGIGNGLRNRLTESIASKDNEKSRLLISSAYAVITVIVIILTIIIFGVIYSLNCLKIFKLEFFDEDLNLIIFTAAAFVLTNFILSVCKNVLYALQKAAHVGFMELLVQLLNLFGILLLSRFIRGNLMWMVIIYGLSMIIVNLVYSVILYCKNTYLRPRPGSVNFGVGLGLANLGVQFFIIQICSLVLLTTDSLLISNLYGTAVVAPYSFVNKLFTAITLMFTALLSPIWSSATKAKTEGRYIWIKQLINKVNIINIPFMLGAVFFGLIFRPFSDIWLNQHIDYSNGLIIMGVVYCIVGNWYNAYAYVANGLELMKESMVISVIQAAVNIPLSLFFAQTLRLESTGILLGTVMAMGISAVALPIIVNKKIREQISSQ